MALKVWRRVEKILGFGFFFPFGPKIVFLLLFRIKCLLFFSLFFSPFFVVDWLDDFEQAMPIGILKELDEDARYVHFFH
jgi:hypothetical protein